MRELAEFSQQFDDISQLAENSQFSITYRKDVGGDHPPGIRNQKIL